MASKFHFTRPEEAPVFTPTEEEFKDPLAYINKIRPQAEAAGICKIKPPANWQPQFAVNVGNFKFTPRVQRLNELEAKTRIKLNFLDQIAKFWELQGSSLKVPTIEKKAVDLYTLHKFVSAEGGKDKLNSDSKWNRISTRMGYKPQKSYGALLKSYYEKILFPYDMFKKKDGLIQGEKSKIRKKGPLRKSPAKSWRIGRNAKQIYDNIEDKAKYACHICKGVAAEEMLRCDGCEDSYHKFCLQPLLPEVPEGDWRCPSCAVEEVSKPGEAFGFDEAEREYTLQEFGQMADQFKSEYFNMPAHMVTSEVVEKEFWRIVSAIDEDVTVEYGADLHTMDHGSGFPTESTNNIELEQQNTIYTKSGWNLNNLPVLQESVLRHINADISGMTVPWVYVGMCFATFCWHNEDHWSYSINYMHWGEPKTWYGVPGCRANDFEIAMKKAAPELFHSQPDLLHQLVTIMNPNILMQAGVPVYRLDQKAGEFVVTFPRAYHAGFNQGYNFAEAVNFAPADWLTMGRDCIAHYSNLRRYCVFSHDELVCKMAEQNDKLDPWTAACTYNDMVKMLETERELRRIVLTWGVTESERLAFEMLPDDNRLCEFCKTTCFLSAITCPCNADQLVCLRHYDKLCECPSETHILKYRHTLDEIPLLMKKLRNYIAEYENWIHLCKQKIINAIAEKIDEDDKMDLQELKDLVETAKKNNYPNSQLIESLKNIAALAEKLTKMAKSFLTSSIRNCKQIYSVDDLTMLLYDLNIIPVKLKETKLINNLVDRLNDMNNAAKYYIANQDSAEYDSKQIKAFLDEAMQMDFEIPDLQDIQFIYRRLQWLENVDSVQGMWNSNQLALYMKIGEDLPRHPTISTKLRYLASLLEFIDMWEKKAKTILTAKNDKFEFEDAEIVVGEADLQPVTLPSLPPLRKLVIEASIWLEKVKFYENKAEYPYIDDLETLVTEGSAFPLDLKPLNILRSQVRGAKVWRDMCAQAFLKKASTVTLIEALVPRKDITNVPYRGKRKRFDINNPNHQLAAMLFDLSIQELKTTGGIAKSYEKRQVSETEELISLRKYNLEKRRLADKESRYCICQKPFGECMIRCELCYQWFHVTCVQLPVPNNTITIPDGISAQAYVAYKIAIGEIKYFGPCCARSKRPNLDTILDLLLKLQKLPVKIVEGEAIHCLTRRAISWMDKAKEFLSCDETSEALKIVKSSKSTASVVLDDATTKRNSKTKFGKMPIKLKNDGVSKGRLSLAMLSAAENLFVESGLMEVSLECESNDLSNDIWLLIEATKNKPLPEKGFSLLRVQDMISRGKEPIGSSCKDSLPESSHAADAKKLIRKPMNRKRKSFSLDEEGNKAKTLEYDDDCAANPCQQPSGKGINWVQCDAGCELWFHLVCVGLKKTQVKKLDTFVCQTCVSKNKEVQMTGYGGGSPCGTDFKILEMDGGSICSNKENYNANISNCSL